MGRPETAQQERPLTCSHQAMGLGNKHVRLGRDEIWKGFTGDNYGPCTVQLFWPLW